MTIEKIKNRLSKEIKQSGISQRQIAIKIGVAPSNVCDYVKEKTLPALDTLAKICVVLDVSADYILGIEDYDGKKNV